MGGLDHALAGGHAAGPHLVDPEYLEGGAGPDHVHDAVDGPHLVEVHLRWWPGVQPSLDLGQGVEHGQGPCSDAFGQAGGGDHRPDVGGGPVHGALHCLHLRLRTGQAASQGRSGIERPAVDGQLTQHFTDLVDRRTGVDECPQGHVAGDPGKAVEPGHAGHVGTTAGGPSRRSTAHAAPKPLSIPTTLRPEAHDASMPSRAVTPSREAP